MPLSKGHRVALYLLISSDSGLRRALEGRSQSIPNPKTVDSPQNDQQLYDRFKAFVIPHLGIQEADCPMSIKGLYVTGGGHYNVATDPKTILTALGAGYDPEAGPCPRGVEDKYVFDQLSGMA